jgi:hypothetical protein
VDPEIVNSSVNFGINLFVIFVVESLTLYHFIHLVHLFVFLVGFSELMIVFVLLSSPMAALGPIFSDFLWMLLLKNL